MSEQQGSDSSKNSSPSPRQKDVTLWHIGTGTNTNLPPSKREPLQIAPRTS